MQIIRGKQSGAKKIIVYGPEGIGKSTFASHFPEPVFIDTEGSTKDMDVARTIPPSSWSMLLEQLKEFIAHPELCRTLVIDTADWAEMLCISHVCSNNQKDSIEAFGYGKGYIYVQEEFGRFLNLLQDLVDRGVNVVLTAHAKMRKFEQPDEMGAYDRWEMKLSKNVAPMVKEWTDMLLFVNYKTFVINVDGQGAQKGKNKAQGGKRTMYTCHHICWDAKNRYGLPEECEFDYDVIRPIIECQTSRQKSPEPEKVQEFPKETRLPDFMDIPEEDANEVIDFDTGKNAEEKKTVPQAFKLPESIPKALRELMEVNLVSEEEIQTVVSNRGYFPKDTPVQNYPRDFIDGVLVGAWGQVYQFVKELRGKYEIPFK